MRATRRCAMFARAVALDNITMMFRFSVSSSLDFCPFSFIYDAAREMRVTARHTALLSIVITVTTRLYASC